MPKGTGFVPCTNCGGTGATTKVEIDKNGKTTTVRVICTKCNGAGGKHI